MADEQKPNDPYGQSPYGQNSDPYGSPESSPFSSSVGAGDQSQGGATAYGQSEGQDGYGSDYQATQSYGQSYDQGQQGGSDYQTPSYEQGQYGQSYDQTQSYDQGQHGQTSSYDQGQYGQAPSYDQGQYGQQAAAYGGGYGANPYGQATTAADVPAKFNVWGLIAVILGGLGIILGLIPIIGWFAPLLGLVAIILGILGLVLKGYNKKKGLAIAGIVLGVLAGLATIIAQVAWGAAFVNQVTSSYTPYSTYSSGSGSGSGSSSQPTSTSASGSGSSSTSGTSSGAIVTDGVADIEITVTSSKPIDVTIWINNYMSGADKVDVSKDLKSQTSPFTFTQSMKLDPDFDLSSVTVMSNTSDYQGESTCEIKIDGKVVATDTSTFLTNCSVSNLAG